MPIYDFFCESCNDTFESLVKMDKRLSQSCPVCSEVVKLVISTPTIALDPISGDFAQATLRWENKRKQHMALEVKQDRCHIE